MSRSVLSRKGFVPAQTPDRSAHLPRPHSGPLDPRVGRVDAEDEAEDTLREKVAAVLSEAAVDVSAAVLDAVVGELRSVTRAADRIKLGLVEIGRRLLAVQRHVG